MTEDIRMNQLRVRILLGWPTFTEETASQLMTELICANIRLLRDAGDEDSIDFSHIIAEAALAGCMIKEIDKERIREVIDNESYS